MKVWLLTSEYNAYDQYGEYFEAVFKDKPTAEALSEIVGRQPDSESVENLLKRGTDYEYGAHAWYKLREEELK